MTSNFKLSRAVRLAILSGASTVGMGIASSAHAQDERSVDQIEEITVTGSRIKRADLDSASPVTVLQREDILAAGLTDVGNLIQRMPSMSGSPIGTTTNNGGNGSVQIDLRGMGVDRTVTLVNGQRVVDGGDYQTIPAMMIERVEILKDGASAVYGADAVAGVVNIITRQNYEGISLNVETADFFDMDDGAQLSAGVIAGKVFDGGNIVFGAEYVDQSQAYQRDAPWDFFQDSYYIYPEGCENQVTAPYDGTPSGGCYVIGSSSIPESYLSFPNNGLFLVPEAGATMIPHDGRPYNYAPVNYIQTPYQRTNVFAEGNFDLSDTVRFRSEIRGNFRESSQELAPQPYFSIFDPGYQGSFAGAAYNGISPDNYYLVQAIDAYNAANGTALPYEPATDVRRRMLETARRFEQSITQYQFVGALEGSFGELDWDVFYNRGYRQRQDNDFGQFSGPQLSAAMGPSADLNNDGTPECYGDVNDPSTLISGCVPFNFFAGPNGVSQDMLDYVGVDLIDSFLTTQEIAGASVTGEAFELPGGRLGWAAGYAYWGQTYEYRPDSGKQLDAVTGNTGAGTKGSLYANSVFAEFLAPVFSNGTQSLDVKGGVRYDEYNAFDGETTWQVGIEFRAIESLKLRGTAGTVFRAPTIINLYGGIVDSFPTYSDPCNVAPADLPAGCAQVSNPTDSQVLARIGGNPNLVPETGDTFTGGLVWTPEFGQSDLTLTLDYWQVDIEDGISSLGVQFILEDCYERQNAASCALITRRADYTVDHIFDTDLNVAEQGARGVDTEVRWNLESGFGQWEAALLWSHLLERTKTASPVEPEVDLSGRYTDPTAEDGGAYATDKLNYSLQWYRGDLSVGYLGEYISGLDADTFCNCGAGNQPDGTYRQKIDSFLYHDLVASYDFTQTGTRIAAGITNLTDEAPPFIEVGFNALTDPSTYRLFGRGYYVRVTQDFQ